MRPSPCHARGGGAVRLGPGSPRLLVFFATWDTEVTDLAAQLNLLGRYEATAAAQGLPQLDAVDEASVEPSPAALPRFLGTLARPLSSPVAIDSTGRVADGYGVQDEPWLVLVSATGRILWYHDISTSGWLATSALVQEVRAALTRPKQPSDAAQTQAELAGSPPALNAVHRQAGQLLGGQSALIARLWALRGYPVVVNAWAAWCGPCRAEFALLASASARYGREVAFVGVDTSDSANDARGSCPNIPAATRATRAPAPAHSAPSPRSRGSQRPSSSIALATSPTYTRGSTRAKKRLIRTSTPTPAAIEHLPDALTRAARNRAPPLSAALLHVSISSRDLANTWPSTRRPARLPRPRSSPSP